MPRIWKLGVARIYGLDQAFLDDHAVDTSLIQALFIEYITINKFNFNSS